jgi:hypothetical protein
MSAPLQIKNWIFHVCTYEYLCIVFDAPTLGIFPPNIFYLSCFNSTSVF